MHYSIKTGEAYIMKKITIVSKLFFFVFIFPLLVNPESPIAQNWYYNTVQIENEWGEKGTGFLILRETEPNQGKIFLCTNKHVLHEKKQEGSHQVAMKGDTTDTVRCICE